MLLRAFRSLPGDLRLVIVGGSSFTADYVEEVERMAADDPRVTMTGYLHGKELDELYANAAVFVLPSVVEGMPLTLLEAAAHGTPILASDIAPHLEVLGADAPGGRVFRCGNETELRDALVAMMGQLPRERQGAEENRRRVLDEYNWDNAATRLSDLYRQVCGLLPRPGAPLPRVTSGQSSG